MFLKYHSIIYFSNEQQLNIDSNPYKDSVVNISRRTWVRSSKSRSSRAFFRGYSWGGFWKFICRRSCKSECNRINGGSPHSITFANSIKISLISPHFDRICLFGWYLWASIDKYSSKSSSVSAWSCKASLIWPRLSPRFYYDLGITFIRVAV